MSDTPTAASAEKKPAAPKKTKARKPARLTLEQAQAAAKENLGSGSGPGMGVIVSWLARKNNLGKLFSPDQVAVGIGNGATGGGVRRALQRKGLAGTEGKQPCIQHDKHFVYLSKEGNRNLYRAVLAGSK